MIVTGIDPAARANKAIRLGVSEDENKLGLEVAGDEVCRCTHIQIATRLHQEVISNFQARVGIALKVKDAIYCQRAQHDIGEYVIDNGVAAANEYGISGLRNHAVAPDAGERRGGRDDR